MCSQILLQFEEKEFNQLYCLTSVWYDWQTIQKFLDILFDIPLNVFRLS